MEYSKNSSKKKNGLVIISAIFILMIISASAGAVPQLPSIFYGSLTINGRAVPPGSVIIAKINDLVRGSATVSTEGYCDQINVVDGNYGDTIAFYVQTPSMANQIQASQTAAWVSGKVEELDLTFSGEEIAKAETPAGSSGSAGSGSGGGQADQEASVENQTVIQPQPEIQGIVYDIDENFRSSENVTLEISKNDEITFTFENERHSIKLKSISEFAVLLSISSDPLDVIIGVRETKNIDLNGDNADEISIALEGIKGNKASLTITKLKKEIAKAAVGPGSAGVTGMMVSGEVLGLAAIVIAGVIAGSYLVVRRRKYEKSV